MTVRPRPLWRRVAKLGQATQLNSAAPAVPLKRKADVLYCEAVRQARSEVFYQAGYVPDTVDGRFDMIVLHVFLILWRLRGAAEDGPELGQAVFDVMFDDMDRSLREMGVGDLGVGRRVKTMAQGFFGRVEAYDSALADNDIVRLQAALGRNLYRGANVPEHAVADLAAYAMNAARFLSEMPDSTLFAAQIGWPDPRFTGATNSKRDSHA